MFRGKMISLSIVVFAILLSSCAPGVQINLPPDLTLVPGTDLPQQVATFVANALTQTAIPPATSTPVPGAATSPAFDTPLPNPGNATLPAFSLLSFQTLYQSPSLGIQFSYPSAWYRVETYTGVTLTSFEPSNPPHKLEWTYETTGMQFKQKVFVTRPAFDAWIEDARQAALAEGWSIHAEERFSIANQPAVRLSLVSGSGGMLDRVLIYELSGRYLEVDIEGNYNNNLARTVLNSIQASSEGVIKPPDGTTPAAGICLEATGDPVNIVLGLDASGLPLAGRCITVHPAQRLKLINHSGNPVELRLMEYPIALPAGGEMLLDKPAGQYLATGVHSMPVGPELWVKETVGATAPPPITMYSNTLVGFGLGLPGDWRLDETSGTNREVIFSPPNPEPFIAYLSISLDYRTLDQIIHSYAQYHPDATREETIFNSYWGVKYIFPGGRNEYFIPYGSRIFLIATDRPYDGTVQSILMTIWFTDLSSTTYDATIMDNGRTFNLKVGDRLRLNLDQSYDWSAVTVSDGTVISGTQNSYQAIVPGSASLSTTGAPKCLKSIPPCLAPSIPYQIIVIVR